MARFGPHQIPFEERFWARVQKSAGCWLWIGAFDSYGYGVLYTTAGKNLKAPRVSWLINVGPIPDGLEVCHNCPGGDRPACVRPDHLFLGTHADNLHDMARKGTRKRTTGHCGHRLTEDNLVFSKRGDGRVFRQCRMCQRAAGREYMRKRRAAMRST